MKGAVIFMGVSSVDQNPEIQARDLQQMAAQRGYEIVNEYTDPISGTKAKRPGLGLMHHSSGTEWASLFQHQ